jgi:hypothetical protein
VIYRMDVKIIGTAYVRADSPEEARTKIDEQLIGEWIEVAGDELISGFRFDDPALPEVSLSPAMTITDFSSDKPEVADD